MRRIMALGVAGASILAGCGKTDVATVTRPAKPIYVCRLGVKADQPCQQRFNAAQLIALRLKAANALAEHHGYTVRRVAPLSSDETLIRNYVFRRIDVECVEVADDCLVKRIVEQG